MLVVEDASRPERAVVVLGDVDDHEVVLGAVAAQLDAERPSDRRSGAVSRDDVLGGGRRSRGGTELDTVGARVDLIDLVIEHELDPSGDARADEQLLEVDLTEACEGRERARVAGWVRAVVDELAPPVRLLRRPGQPAPRDLPSQPVGHGVPVLERLTVVVDRATSRARAAGRAGLEHGDGDPLRPQRERRGEADRTGADDHHLGVVAPRRSYAHPSSRFALWTWRRAPPDNRTQP